jgi:hypothetical protein
VEAPKIYLPPVNDATSGQLHYYVGYADTEVKHCRLNLGNIMCTCKYGTKRKETLVGALPS